MVETIFSHKYKKREQQRCRVSYSPKSKMDEFLYEYRPREIVDNNFYLYIFVVLSTCEHTINDRIKSGFKHYKQLVGNRFMVFACMIAVAICESKCE